MASQNYKRYAPDLSGINPNNDPLLEPLVAVIRRNLEQLGAAIGDIPPAIIGGGVSSGGGSTTPVTPHDHVLTRHLAGVWSIAERVAVSAIVEDNSSAVVVEADANTELVEIGG